MFAILRHFVPKKGDEGFFIVFVENPEGRGGYRFLGKMENAGSWGGGGGP